MLLLDWQAISIEKRETRGRIRLIFEVIIYQNALDSAP